MQPKQIKFIFMLKRFENLGVALNRNESKMVVGGNFGINLSGVEVALDDDGGIMAESRVMTGWTLVNGNCLCDYQYTVRCNTGVGIINRCEVPCEASNCC